MIPTHKEMQRLKRKRQRQELKTIENHLHPEPEPLNGFEILHRHQGQYIFFEGWQNDQPTARFLKFHRSEVLNNPHFYNANMAHFKWLCHLTG